MMLMCVPSILGGRHQVKIATHMIMKPINQPGSPFKLNRIVLIAALMLLVPTAFAASGTWTNDANSAWSVGTNWLNSVVANGTDATADFSTIDITANRTVTLDSSRTIGNLTFADTNGAQAWLLNGTAGSILTLATSSGTPTITVTNSATISASVAGSSGLTKAGSGTLLLAGTNSFTGTTTVGAGVLSLTNSLNLAGGSTVTNTGPIIYFSFDNISGGYVYNQGVGGHADDGILVGAAALIPSGTARGSCLFVGPTNKAAGYVFVNNPGPMLNAAGSSWTVAMWVKVSQNGSALAYQGSGVWASGNTILYADNPNPENLATSTHMGLVGHTRFWEAGTSNIVDNVWHLLVYTSTSGNHTNYVDGTVDPLLDNSFAGAAATGNQLWVGGTPNNPADGNLWGASGAMIDEFYMYNRALSQAEVTALYSASSGPTALAAALPDHASVSVASGAKLDLNGATTLVDSLGGSGIADNLSSGNGQLILNVTSPTSYGSGVFSNTSGSLSIVKAGSSTLTLTGDQTYSGATVVNEGTLNITGNLKPYNTAATTSGMTVRSGKVIFSGSVITNYNYNIGTSSNLTAAFYQNSGFLRESQGASGSAFQLGSGAYGYGYYYLAAGATNFCGEIGIAGEGQPSGYGQADVFGTLTNNGWVTMARGAQPQQNNIPSIGVLNVYPGGLVTYAGGGLQCNWANNTSPQSQVSIVNVLGGSVLLLTNLSVNLSVDLNRGGAPDNLGIVNLNNGGTLSCGWVVSGVGRRMNFNGGRLLATENQAAMFSAASGSTPAAVYAGGGTVDNAGFNLTFGQSFNAPSGNGVSISSFTGGTGYTAPPIVTVVSSDGNGVGATAIAQINPASGVVTNILMTCPGQDYTATPTFQLIGGNPATAATITGGLTANTSGGMSFIGAGTTTLSGGYTYTGATLVSGGGLSLVSSTVTPSVAGDIIVSNAVLNVDSSSGTALPVNNLNLTNAAVTIAVPASSAGINVAGSLTFQNNATNNFNYGNVSVNPAFPAINASGSIAAPGANIVLNVSAVGLQPGTLTLIKYTGTALGSIANFSVTLPPGVNGTLVNNTGNDSIDLNITSTPNVLSWNGVNGTNWDLATANWSNTITAAASVFRQYTNGSVVAGDSVVFDDTVTNDFVNLQPTNINLTGKFYAFPVTVNSTLPYSIAGAGGINGSVQLLKTNSGSLTLLTSNSFTGGVTVGGGTLVITNDTALGASSGVLTLNGSMLQVNGNTTNNARALNIPATATVGVLTNTSARFGGTVAGAGGLTKIDNGTLVLAGTNGVLGNLLVRQGTLTTLGANALPAVVRVGDTAALNGVLNVGAGVFNANNNGGQFASSLIAGSVAGAYGDITINGGTINVAQQLGLGAGAGGYGALTLNSGSLLTGSYIVVGFNNDTAVFNQNGGTVTLSSNLMTIAAGGTAAVGVANFTGGTFTSVFANSSGIMVGERGTGTMNVSGSASIITTNSNGLTVGPIGSQTGWSGTLNLNGGTVTSSTIKKGGGTGTAKVNFNGGTIKAGATSATFLNGLDLATVYGNGLTVDDGGFAITIPQVLVPATGAGVSSIALSSGGSGYMDSPIVTISGGSGSNATANATVSGGTVTAVVVTSPGTGYSLSDSLSVSFSGGGANVVSPTVSAVNLANNSGGGLTKKGAGTLTLTGSNSITGAVSVNTGALTVNTLSSLTGGVVVSNTASLTITQVGSATNNLSALTLNGGSAIPGATLGVGLSGLNSTVPFVNCGTLTLNGTNTLSVAGGISLGTIPVVKYSALAGSGTLTNLTLPQGISGYVSNSVTASTIFVVVTNTGPGLVWTGFNTNAALTNLWDIASTTNWLLGASATTYRQPIIPGDAVVFNDSGSGTVRLNANVGPSSLTISNNAVNYTFSGSGTISGSTGVSKLGSGTAILNLTNNSYTGNTIISKGTLQLGSANVIPDAAGSVNINTNATLDLAGFSESINGLAGSGTVNNSSGTTVVFTTGGGNASSVWNGTITNTGAGGITFIKTGTGALAIGGTNFWSGTSQISGGSLELTPGASVNGTGEFWIGGSSTATFTNNGGTLNVQNWLVVGRTIATANGTLVVNSGTIQKTGANNIVVGSLGATGTLIVNGGQVLNSGMLWLGEGATANASLYLNGGLIQASEVRPNGATPLTYNAYFNGGILQAIANNANFLQVFCNVMSNGLVLDDNGFTLNIGGAVLAAGDANNGGLIKKGSGKVYLDAGNTYTGTTVVSNGILAGVGSVSGPVVVASAGKLGAGNASASVGTFTVNNNVTINGGAIMRVSKTGGTPAQDQVVVSGNITYGGTLIVTNVTSDATPLTTSDTFQLYSVTGTPSGNFSSIVGSPGTGLAYSFNPASGVLSVVTGVASNPTNITFSVSGGTLSLSWPSDHLGWILQQQTNSLSVGLGTNWVDVAGSESVTQTNINISVPTPSAFYRLRKP